jgi:hypothetical protein
MANNVKETQNKNTSGRQFSTEGGYILWMIWSKETYSVDVFLAAVLVKSNRPRNGRFQNGVLNNLIYKSFLLGVV